MREGIGGFAFCFGFSVVAGVGIGEGGGLGGVGEDAEGFEPAVLFWEVDVLGGGWGRTGASVEGVDRDTGGGRFEGRFEGLVVLEGG